jgi:hypothetical protein
MRKETRVSIQVFTTLFDRQGTHLDAQIHHLSAIGRKCSVERKFRNQTTKYGREYFDQLMMMMMMMMMMRTSMT